MQALLATELGNEGTSLGIPAMKSRALDSLQAHFQRDADKLKQGSEERWPCPLALASWEMWATRDACP